MKKAVLKERCSKFKIQGLTPYHDNFVALAPRSTIGGDDWIDKLPENQRIEEIRKLRDDAERFRKSGNNKESGRIFKRIKELLRRQGSRGQHGSDKMNKQKPGNKGGDEGGKGGGGFIPPGLLPDFFIPLIPIQFLPDELRPDYEERQKAWEVSA